MNYGGGASSGVVVWVAYDAHYVWPKLGVAVTSLGTTRAQ